jgi:hypothetical protein
MLSQSPMSYLHDEHLGWEYGRSWIKWYAGIWRRVANVFLCHIDRYSFKNYGPTRRCSIIWWTASASAPTLTSTPTPASTASFPVRRRTIAFPITIIIASPYFPARTSGCIFLLVDRVHVYDLVLLPLVWLRRSWRIHSVDCWNIVWISWEIFEHALSAQAHFIYATQLSITLPRLMLVLPSLASVIVIRWRLPRRLFFVHIHILIIVRSRWLWPIHLEYIWLLKSEKGERCSYNNSRATWNVEWMSWSTNVNEFA